MVTTTDQGGGRPRLMFAMGGSAPRGAKPREFSLREGATTRIGSGAQADLRLDGLAEQHAEIRCEDDEYLLVDLGTPGGSRVDGRPVDRAPLHTGDRIDRRLDDVLLPGRARRPRQAVRRPVRRRITLRAPTGRRA